MKAILALGLLAVVGFAVAGCGAAKETVSAVITNTGSTTLTNGGPLVAALRRTVRVTGLTATIDDKVTTGIWIRCKGWPAPGVKVPPRGESLVADMGEGTVTITGKKSHPVSRELRLTHLRNGSIRVVCRRSS